MISRTLDQKETMYTISFPEGSAESLNRLAVVLEGLMPEEYIQVKQEAGFCYIGITTYEELTG